MKNVMAVSVAATILCTTLFCCTGLAQNSNGPRPADETQCPGMVYRLSEVSTKPNIKSRPDPMYTERARRNRVSGQVVLDVVLCRTKKVMDIEVIRGLSHGLTESAIEAARRIRFTPGEKDGNEVSVKVRVIYNFNVY
jgi:protein TonB